MSRHFLAQLAHRALAGSDVRPRIAARFEQAAPAEPLPLAVQPAAPSRDPELSPIPPLHRELPRSAPHRRDAVLESLLTRVETRHEIKERVSSRVHTVELASPPARAATPEPTQASLAAVSPSAMPALTVPAPVAGNRTTAAETTRPTPVRDHLPAPTQPPMVAPVRAVAAVQARPALVALLAPAAPAPPPPATRTRPAEPPAAAPIEIIIGRIEIRGEAAPAAARNVAPPEPRRGASLNEYLRGREGRTR